MRRVDRSPLAKKAAATGLIVALVAIIVLSVAQFFNVFADTKPVYLIADRAGLVMNPDAKVRLRGVVIGRVKSIKTTDDGRVQLKLAMSADQMHRLPANVGAEISSNTVFGAKSVNMIIPENADPQHLQSGARIEGAGVVVELNTLYQRLVNVLAKIQPEKLNATMSAVDTALQGKGKEIGQGLADLSDFLGTTNKHIGNLNRDIEAGAITMQTYADVAPELTRIIDNAVFTGNTLRANSSDLDAILVNATGMANTINGIIAPKKAQIISMLSNFNPTAQLLGYQSPDFKCFLTATASLVQSPRADIIFGKGSGALQLDTGVIPGTSMYTYPMDLPKVNADGPPSCADPLGNPSSTAKPGFYVTDNANMPYQPRMTARVDRTKLFGLLFAVPQHSGGN